MKAGAPILVVLGVGALVAVGVAGLNSSRDAGRRPVVSVPKEETVTRPTIAAHVTRPPAAPALINIPRLGLRVRIGLNVYHGPAWWPVTGRPGGGDTIAVAGHRTTHTRPFHSLDRLRAGDAIYVRWAGRMHAYRVSGRRILSANSLHIGDARGYEVLLLSACHPRGSARQRIVVYARPRA
jgi:LPXTG-site transpeptidase (sortase) family protein